MSVRLTDGEAWDMVSAAHTGIFTTLTSAGWPVSLPVWFVVEDREIFVRTPERAKKVARIRGDDRGCFLVERGEQWSELAAVEMPVRASIVDDPVAAKSLAEQFDSKYGTFRTSRRQMPDATRSHYSGMTLVKLAPSGDLLTWDNARLRLPTGS